MAAKLEEVSTAPTEGVGIAGATNSEKQSETPAPASAAKQDETLTEKTGVEDATAGVADLAVSDKDVSAKKEEEAAAGVAAPTTGTTPSTTGPTWPDTAPEHPLTKFYDVFETLVAEAAHNEVYGIELSKTSPFHTKLILQKFLRANQNDLEKAKQQLLDTLKWRKEFDPTKAASESFERRRFDGLGYVLEVEGVPESPNKTDVVTFNIYGAVKDNKATFGDLEGFLRWRVGLMEKSVLKLNLSNATQPIPDYNEGPDPYQGFQIHDYLRVSFLRQDPLVKAATKKTIEILGHHYPETLSRKFFVNVPVVMGWLYSAMKMVIAKETVKKFTVLSYGNQLVTELGPNIPKVYGGNAGELSEVGEGVKFTE
ncbi:CRAL/TRIO domain-containing protein [Cucurbitaria berberidis CBS 394.84]|uniref:Phosphatidylinositol transfer protein SFH5 n=1 Tax=Cucurbitaria berberidis CBS 394.84 TaxID=1168544 RepID=A0A9P4L5D0_9PLEO|nr:CRAL/TRIO domain-containing protein [Cucurbitaria berberidis CBS 394.84]KAF1842495.1 CRAL/TRIO domain-containing protein [Cucurbitaria berberidis CBS 394.84]